MERSERENILESQFHWGDRSVVVQLWNIAFCFNNDLFLCRLYIDQCKWFREWSTLSYTWWPMDPCREFRQFLVKGSVMLALSSAKIEARRQSKAIDTPSFSCCPCVAVSHFQFPALGMYVWELTPVCFCWNSTERNSVAVMWVVFLFLS